MKVKNTVLGVVMLGAGGALLYWGYNITQSVSAKLNEAIGGAPPDKAMIMLGVGGICVAFGFFKLFKIR